MGGFSVALSALAVSTVSGAALEPAGDTPQVIPSLPDQSITLATDPTFLSGFRMEGSPEVELVFGDTKRFRHRVDRYYELDRAMEKERTTFGGQVQRVLAGLAGQAKGGCPVDTVAAHYTAARRAGESFRALGGQLQGEREQIRGLNDLGETQALTPDYRWKVRQVEPRFQAALTDLREMRVALLDQLGAELRHRGCKVETLLARGEALIAAGALDVPAVDPAAGPPATVPPKRGEEIPVAHARTATFFVDNRACAATLGVTLDDQLLGEVPAGERGAFQALAGRHSLCLLESGSGHSCGEPGTLRNAYVHDGWSIALHCQGEVPAAPAASKSPATAASPKPAPPRR
jgi:hypothetical protein